MQVPQIDIKGIFERAAGHPAQEVTRTIICGTPKPHELVDNTRTLNGVIKPGTFVITPSKRREQFFV